MGRIRTDEIRSITEKVLSKYSLESFSSSFRENKEKLKSMPEKFPSKKVLNRVAGSITRAFKQKQIEMQKLLEPGSAEEEPETLS
jgi:ribosomal protein S17E